MSTSTSLLLLIYHYLSMTSLSLAMIAFIPQIILIYYNKSFKNLSLSFIIIITIQDIINIFLLSDSTEILLSTTTPSSSASSTISSIISLYYCFLDLVILTQYYYYHHYLPSLSFSNSHNQLSTIAGTTILANTVDAHPIETNIDQTQPGIPQPPPTPSSIPSIVNASFSITSRLPQIYYNSKYKSTQGVSIYLFIFTFTSNLCLAIAIGINMYFSLVYSPPNGSNNQIILLASAIAMMGLDAIILFQFWLYKQSSETSPSTQVPHQPRHTRAPSWYTRNQPFQRTVVSPDDDDDQENPRASFLVPHQQINTNTADEQLSPNERTALLTSAPVNYHYSYQPAHSSSFLTSPPPHYILSSQPSTPSGYQPPGDASPWSNLLMQKFTSGIRRHSKSSITDSIGNKASSPTNLIPSIVGHMSNLNKKMNDEQKIPFSPSDFLHDEYYASPTTTNTTTVVATKSFKQ